MTRLRRVTALCAAVAATLTVAACGGGAGGDGEAQPIDIGYIADFNGASLLAVAEEKGIWDRHGLDASTSAFTNGPLQVQALGAGDLDFGYIGPGAFWLPASGQAKIVALNTLGNADRVIAQEGITSMEQLRGRTVGVPQGTSGDMILSIALQEAGLTKQDVEVVPMDPATVVSAFASKQVDAAGFWYPAIDTIKRQNPGLVELAKNSDFAGTMQFPTAFVAGNEVVSEQSDTASRTVAALREAMTYRAANMDETIALTADMLNLPEEQVRADAGNVEVLDAAQLDTLTRDGTVDGWLNRMQDYFVEAGNLDRPADPATWYTGDLFTAAGS